MRLYRSPAVYDVIVKNNSKDEEKITHSSWMENVQIILNTESTLCLLCFYAPLYYLLIACMFWSYISLKFLTYNCFNYLFICNYFKKYVITYVRICKCKEVSKLIN